MFSTQVSRASAGLLLTGGLALLFVPDAILPRLVPGFPAGGFSLGSPLPGFDRLIERTRDDLGEQYEDVVQLLGLMVKMDTEQAEIVATLYAAWNNLLLDGLPATDEDIVRAAREDWHPDKLKIERDRFFSAIGWMRGQGLVPAGTGSRVADRPASAKAARKRR